MQSNLLAPRTNLRDHMASEPRASCYRRSCGRTLQSLSSAKTKEPMDGTVGVIKRGGEEAYVSIGLPLRWSFDQQAADYEIRVLRRIAPTVSSSILPSNVTTAGSGIGSGSTWTS